MRTDYRSLEMTGNAGAAFDHFLGDFNEKLNDSSVNKYDLVCETIYQLETGKRGYLQL